MDKERQYKTPLHRRKNIAAASKRLRDFYRDNGICYVCGRNYAKPGRVLCPNCEVIHRRRLKKYDPDGTKHKEYVKQKREQWKQAGLCVDCGKRKAKEGYVRCGICLKKVRERCQVYRLKKRIKQQQKGRMR